MNNVLERHYDEVVLSQRIHDNRYNIEGVPVLDGLTIRELLVYYRDRQALANARSVAFHYMMENWDGML